MYKLGIVVGRFQVLTLGHTAIIDNAIKQCEKIIICIGSADKERENKNPFSYKLRRKWLTEYIKNNYQLANVYIIPLVDIEAGDSPIWGNYVLRTCKVLTGQLPEAYFTGSEPDRGHWLDNYPDIKVITTDRQELPISATMVREKLIKGEDIKDYTPEVIWKKQKTLSSYLLKIPTPTPSIK